ncbi:efflux RND transporter periplasmic adaptor subunit [Pseudomonas oryzihabitans]|uniref:efflux RND transporter periplasmic adaptor subunit n=1 Tax=Pseudomonas oryzihabitans TaxID=47885 RepID=UPI00289475AF|nr:efflux RND transporter periplasmic adaptor subunit [Pseudomonas oryzihabitans]MDT3722545.1 efflux RND transporter periplasmic adaptor subunit [Pseudomonas oryzihabitans]
MRCILLVGVLLVLAGCSNDDETPPPIRPVATMTLSAPPLQREVFAGSIQARYESVLGFRVGGRMTRRLLDVGAPVRRDQLLAALDPTDQDNALRSREGQAADAEAQWRDARNDARRQQQLFDQGVGSRSQLDQALTRLHTLEASREQALSAERQARDQRNYAELYSDFEGVITAWQAEVGQVVSAGQPVVRVARPDIREAVLDLPAQAIGHLAPEREMTVRMALDPEVAVVGKVREIEPQADATTRTRRVRLTLNDPPEALRIGTLVQGELELPAAQGLALPVQALRRQGDQTMVWVVEGQGQQAQVRQRPVQVLREADGQAWIGSGLSTGERVVVAGVNSLEEGQRVKDQEGARP